MYLVKTPTFVQNFYNSLTWTINSADNIYLTFDDGPDPLCTPWVLDTLNQFDAKATFFCIGKNAEAHPDLIDRIISEGHSIGNHSYSHYSGWTTSTKNYVVDVDKCASLIKSNLFRPPYGRLKPAQLKKLKAQYKIIMWDVMIGDFDKKLSPDQCLSNATEIPNAGSIVLFHDTIKCLEKLKYVLPMALDFYDNEGLYCKALPG